LLNNRLSVSWPVVTRRSSKVTGSARCNISVLNSCEHYGLNEANQEALLFLLREAVTICTQRPTVFPQTARKRVWMFLLLGDKEVCQNKLFLSHIC